MATLSSRIHRSLLSHPVYVSRVSMAFSTSNFDTSTLNSDTNNNSESLPDSESQTSADRPPVYERKLENGLDMGIYKAILVGQVGQNPMQKMLRNGRNVTLFSVATGGIRDNRKPMDDEDPRDYANRASVQWHRVCVYPEKLGQTVMKHARTGTILYIEGNLEQKVFTDPMTGVRRIREVAVRANGRIVFLGNNDDGLVPKKSKSGFIGYQ